MIQKIFKPICRVNVKSVFESLQLLFIRLCVIFQKRFYFVHYQCTIVFSLFIKFIFNLYLLLKISVSTIMLSYNLSHWSLTIEPSICRVCLRVFLGIKGKGGAIGRPKDIHLKPINRDNFFYNSVMQILSTSIAKFVFTISFLFISSNAKDNTIMTRRNRMNNLRMPSL